MTPKHCMAWTFASHNGGAVQGHLAPEGRGSGRDYCGAVNMTRCHDKVRSAGEMLNICDLKAAYEKEGTRPATARSIIFWPGMAGVS